MKTMVVWKQCIFYDLCYFSFCSWQRGRKICVTYL